MATADTNRVSITIREETAWGEAINGGSNGTGWSELRTTGVSLEHQKTSEESETIRSDRMVDSVAELAAVAVGSVDFELAQGSTLNLWEGLIGGTRVVPGTVDFTSVPAASGTLTKTALGTSATVGQFLRVSGSTVSANNGLWQVASKSGADEITLVDKNGVGFADSTGNTIKLSTFIRNGTAARSYQLEQAFNDVAKYFYFNGLRVGQMSLDLTAQSRITGSVTFDGKRGQFLGQQLGTRASVTAAPLTDPLTSSANVQGLLFDLGGGTTPAQTPLIQQITLDINGNNRQQPVVGSKYSQGIGQGTISMTGSMNMYFQDEEFFDLMEAHSYFKMSIPMTDAAGGGFVITFPRMVLTEGSPTAPGRNQDVFENKGFQAVRDANALGGTAGVGYGIQIDDIPA